MGDHTATHISDRQVSLLVIAFASFRDSFDIDGHGLVHALQSFSECQRCRPLGVFNMRPHTFLSHSHFCLESFEIIREVGLSLSAHLLARPLLEAVQLLVDNHCVWLVLWNCPLAALMRNAVAMGNRRIKRCETSVENTLVQAK